MCQLRTYLIKWQQSHKRCIKSWRLYYCDWWTNRNWKHSWGYWNRRNDWADAEIEADRIENSEEELEESPSALVTVTETYEALKEVVRFEEQLVDENFGIEKQHLLRNHYTTMIDILQY